MGVLEGQVALVTGASMGIGRATADRLAAEGANLILNYHDPSDRERGKDKAIDEVVATVRKYGVDVLPHEADVSNKNAVESMVAKADEHFGRIDILVNNAGIGTKYTEIQLVPEHTYDHVLAVNLKGQFLVAQAVVPRMIRRKYGRIVNVASQLALTGGPGATAYCASKAGVIGFTKSLARELAPHGILVNCVAPGPVDTDMLEEWEREEAFVNAIPLRRIGQPVEIAEAIFFMASPNNSWTTGQVLSPNGGFVI